MNVDIDRDVVVGFDGDGKPLNHLGDLVPYRPGTRLFFSSKLLDGIRSVRNHILDEDGGDENSGWQC